MKHLHRYRSLLPTLLLSSLPFAAHAHPPHGEGPDRCEPGPAQHRPPPFGEGRFGPGDPGIPPHLRALHLTEAQQDKVFDILHGSMPAMREKMKVARGAREALETLAMSDRFDVQKARSLADAHAKAMAEVMLARAEADAGIYAVLTPDQRAQLDAHRRDRERGPQAR